MKSLSAGSIPPARYRLGFEPMKWLFTKVATTWAKTAGLSDYRGLALYGVDGSHIRVQDSDENFEHFGKPGGRFGPGDSGYPQVRVACLLNLSNRLLLDARFGTWSDNEQSLASELWPSVPDNSLTILDRGFVNYAAFADLVTCGANRHLMIRMTSNMKPEVVEHLSDGTLLVELQPRKELLKTHPGLPPKLTGRVIEYKHPGGQASRLFVTLVDPATHPARELIELYHERWELEVAYDELKTHMLERRESLRSKKPRRRLPGALGPAPDLQPRPPGDAPDGPGQQLAAPAHQLLVVIALDSQLLGHRLEEHPRRHPATPRRAALHPQRPPSCPNVAPSGAIHGT